MQNKSFIQRVIEVLVMLDGGQTHSSEIVHPGDVRDYDLRFTSHGIKNPISNILGTLPFLDRVQYARY